MKKLHHIGSGTRTHVADRKVPSSGLHPGSKSSMEEGHSGIGTNDKSFCEDLADFGMDVDTDSNENAAKDGHPQENKATNEWMY